MSWWESSFTRWFCHPTDTAETKRKKFLFVVIDVVFLIQYGFSVPINALNGVALTSHPGYAMLASLIIILAHCRITKTIGSSRLFYASLLYYNIHGLFVEGGFMSNRNLSSSGGMAAVLASFLCTSRCESIFWFVLFFAANITIAVLQTKGFVPHFENTLQGGVLSSMGRQVVYFIIFWFFNYVYNRELTVRKSLQEELQLFARLSHEIRTPLTIIASTIEMMQDWPLTSEQKCCASEMATAERRLRSVVNNLLAFSEHELKRTADGIERSEEIVTFGIREAVDSVIDFHITQAERAELNVYTDIPSDLPFEVQGEKSKLVCVLDHLIDNAVRYTNAGSIIIRVKPCLLLPNFSG